MAKGSLAGLVDLDAVGFGGGGIKSSSCNLNLLGEESDAAGVRGEPTLLGCCSDISRERGKRVFVDQSGSEAVRPRSVLSGCSRKEPVDGSSGSLSRGSAAEVLSMGRVEESRL